MVGSCSFIPSCVRSRRGGTSAPAQRLDGWAIPGRVDATERDGVRQHGLGLVFGWAVVSCLFLFSGRTSAGGLDAGPGGEPKEIVTSAKGPVTAFIISDGAEILDAPKPKAKVVHRAKFLEPYYLAKDPVREKDEEFVLLANVDENLKIRDLVGWARREDCLLDREAKKTEYGIYRKALIVNNWERIKDPKDRSNIKAAAVLNGPGKRADGRDYDKLAEIGLYDFYYVFEEVTRGGAKFFLLGDRPLIVSQRQPQEAIRGWVADERIFRWNTRQAIEFNKDNLKQRTEGLAERERGVKVFGSEQEAQWWSKGIKATPGSDKAILPVAEEDITVTFWRHNWQRYPLLASKDVGESRAGRLLQVGFIGDQIYLEGDRKGLSATEMAEAKEKLKLLGRKLRNVDLVFVIDSTGSMVRYFSSAAKAVQAIVKQIGASYDPSDPEKPKVQFSVLLYRDYVDQDGLPNPADSYLTKRLPLTGDVEKVAKFITEEPSPPDGAGGDEPEAVFHAIYTAVNSSIPEMTDLSFRAVVLLGDKGNHPEDLRGYNVVDLAKFLKDHQIDFYAIHVVDDEKLVRDPDARLFQDQVQILNLQLGMERNTSYYRNMDPRQVAKYIVEAGSRVTEDSKLLVEMIRRTGQGGTGSGLMELKKQYGLRLTEKFTAMMRKAGLDPEAFVNDSVQVFGEGWVSEIEPKTGLPQVSEVVLVNRADYEILVGLLAGFTRKPPTKENVRQLWTSVLQTNLGEENVDVKKTVAELIRNQLGLIVRKKLLHKTLDEISNLPPNDLTALYEDLMNDLRLMRGVLMEQDLAIEKEKVKTPDGTERQEVRVKTLGFHKYWWQASDQEFAWIPMTLLP